MPDFSTTKLRLWNRTAESHVSGHWAYIRCDARGGVASGWRRAIEINDKYLMILRRQEDGTWKIAGLMWSKDQPQLELMRRRLRRRAKIGERNEMLDA